MQSVHLALSGLALAAVVSALGACADSLSAPSGPAAPSAPSDGGLGAQPGSPTTPSAATIRLRCEGSSGRSKVSVDGSGLVPPGGTFQATVSAAGVTVTSPLQSAVAGEAEFDFDSNPNDVVAGATPIPATFVTAGAGPDIMAAILDVTGQVIATRDGECTFR